MVDTQHCSLNSSEARGKSAPKCGDLSGGTICIMTPRTEYARRASRPRVKNNLASRCIGVKGSLTSHHHCFQLRILRVRDSLSSIQRRKGSPERPHLRPATLSPRQGRAQDKGTLNNLSRSKHRVGRQLPSLVTFKTKQ